MTSREPKLPGNTTQADPGLWPPQDKGKSLHGAGTFGMALFLTSLAVSFAAVLVGYLVLRYRLRDDWLPPGYEFPPSLWISTGLIVVCSLLAHWALTSVRRDRQASLRLASTLLLVVGLAFTAFQARAWNVMIDLHHESGMKMFAIIFYLMTGLHGLHVVGGLIYQTYVACMTFTGAYWSLHYPGVRYSTMYWHFLDGIWVVLFLALLLGM